MDLKDILPQEQLIAIEIGEDLEKLKRFGFIVVRLPAGWVHPHQGFDPLPLNQAHEFARNLEQWCTESTEWVKGRRYIHPVGNRGGYYVAKEAEYQNVTYEDYAGERPEASEYLPLTPDMHPHWAVYMPYWSGLGYIPASPTYAHLVGIKTWVRTLLINEEKK